MNKFTTTISKVGFIALMLLAFTACDSDDGPLEKAAESIDKTTTDMGNKIEDACEDMKEGMDAKDTDC
jgi:hypothetical protein